MKRRAVDLFGLADEVDVYSRLEFELFAFGVIPTSSSLPLLRDREVVYVNLLPPRPPTPFSLTLAPSRAENSLVAEVRRPGTGLPFEVVYTEHTAPAHAEDSAGENVSVPTGTEPPKPTRKASRFREHMSENGSRKSRSVSVGDLDSPTTPGQSRRRSPGKVWYTESGTGENVQGTDDPFQGSASRRSG
jgi:hypothetical protein